MARRAFLELRDRACCASPIAVGTPLPRVPKLPAPLWHSRQTVKTTGRRSSLAFMEPCGLWQVSQPSTRTGGCSKTNGPRLSTWHLMQGVSLLSACSTMRGRCRHPPGRRERAVRIVAIRALHEAFVHAVLGRHIELRAHRGVAGVAELALLLRQQIFRRGRMVDGVAAGAGHIVQRVFGAADIGPGEIAGMAGEAAFRISLGSISEKACGIVVLPPRASTWALAGPWQPSQPVRSGGSLPDAMLL